MADAIKIKRVSAERFNEMLEIMFPMMWTEKGFLVVEPVSFRTCTVSGIGCQTYSAFLETRSMDGSAEYFESCEAITKQEWRKLTVNNAEIV